MAAYSVDHGKTTLSDSLLASNGIISQKLAGKVRYLDSRPDEQERGITMESSGISLYFSRIIMQKDDEKEKDPQNNPQKDPQNIRQKLDYLINLIDSPGHVDFSCEVSTASRLCDGGLLLVDAVEGVCAQTQTVLRQAIREKVKPILVLNKVDRLITELKQSPEEAFDHLSQILEQVNAILGEFEAQEILLEHDANTPAQDDADLQEETEKKDYYFAPEKGNVIFSSAIDGWAFRTSDFATLYASKMGINEAALNRFMWGKYYLDPKTKRIIGPKALKGRNLKPLFVQFALENIWKVYNTIMVEMDTAKIEKIVQSLGVQVSPRELKTKDVRSLLQSVMSQWLPLAKSVLIAVVQKIPNPREAQSYRMESILAPSPMDTSERSLVNSAIRNCDPSPNAPVTCFLSKIFSVSASDLPATEQDKIRNQEAIMEMRRLAIARSKARAAAREGAELTAEQKQAMDATAAAEEASNQIQDAEEVFIGFARIYSGSIKVGQKVHILSPKYDWNDPEKDQYSFEMTVERLFLLMGKELQDLDSVPAGNVFGILCSDENVLKTATISASLHCPSLAGLKLEAPPILRVALEPSDPTQLSQLIRGLHLLDRADPAVQVEFEETGENVIVCAGELHLERCIKDLKERYAKIGVEASEPLVPFRETISTNPSLQLLGQTLESPLGTFSKSSNGLTLQLRIVPLPSSIRHFLLSNSERISALQHKSVTTESRLALIKEVIAVLEKDDEPQTDIGINDWKGVVENIVAFGAKGNGSNILVNCVSEINMQLWTNSESKPFEYQSSIMTAFQMATLSGPLCSEQMAGVAILIEKLEWDTSDLTLLSGQILSGVKDGIKAGFLQWSPRLMLAMYSCDLQTEAQFLGKVDGVLSRRRGRIVSEDIKDGTTLFSLDAALPVVESFGFVDELRKKTSGVASPQLVFSGFEVLDIDPFWVPTTEEELEDLGSLAERENIAKLYMEKVRMRKGLFVEKKIVEHGEKQRNMKNK